MSDPDPDPHDAGALASIALLRGRIARLPALAAEVMSRPWSEAIAALSGEVVVTGIGASAGPARLFAWLLAERLRLAARFVPLSAFAAPSPPPARTLVLVTQGLSPNARLALRHAARYEHALVLTSTPPSAAEPGSLLADLRGRGGVVEVLPPTEEDGLLLRVLGPAAAMIAAMMIVERARGAADLDALAADLPRALATAGERALGAAARLPIDRLDGPCAFVSIGADPAALASHRWKWLEGLRAGEPCGWDLLEIAHGPIQSLRAPLPFLILAGPEPGDRALIARLDQVLAPLGHPRAVLPSALRFPFSIADHDAQLDALLLHVLDARPRDLRVSACAAPDEPLYGLGRRPGDGAAEPG